MKATLHRKLVAIMFTDMVGFTALMQRDEALGLEKRNRHKEVIQQYHAQYQGEIIQYFGDGTLSIFANSFDAVACAIDMQKALKAPVEVPLRIGIHTGNVVIEEDGIIGDAVNLASRIESFANVGGVLISDTVQDQLKNQSQWQFVRLGKFQLKNVERPFDIYAVDTEGVAVPDLNHLQGKGQKLASLKSTIPTPATALIGREKEVKDLIELLHSHQVVTITGTGGMGKTRLSLEICSLLQAEFEEGIAFVSLATLTEATEVIPAVAAALDVKEAEGRALIYGVAALITDKKALLVLDNLEQVISAAKEIAELVSLCPNLKILCTSRTPLKIKAEWEYALHPLQLPERTETASLMDYPAIRLFVDRAQKANIDFKLSDDNAGAVLAICRRMDGLPLALELAAARIRILPPHKLLQRLSRALDLLTAGSKDLPERQQTLRATIDWSHNLLTEAEQRLFRRLGVFAGGCTMEAIEEICYENEEEAWLAINELESLIDKGLVENVDGGHKFNLLQTIQDFAVERLREKEETDFFLQKHAEYYAEFSVKLRKGTQGQQQIAAMKQGALEEANIQAALNYLLGKAKTGDEAARELGLNICGELFMYWHIRGKHQSAKNYINAFLGASEDQTPSIGKCRALFHLHIASFTLGEVAQSKAVAERDYKMATQLNHELEMGKGAFALGFGHMLTDPEKANHYSDEAITRFRQLSNDYWLGFSLWQKGLILLMSGNTDSAKVCQAESLALFQKIKDNEGMGCALSGLALLDFIAGQLEEAIEKYQQALSAFEAVGDRPEEARVLDQMSWTYLAAKNTIAARKYTLASIQAYQEVGSKRGIGIAMNGLAAIEAVEDRPFKAIEIAAAAAQFADQEGIVVEFGANNHGKIYLDNARKKLSETAIEKAENAGRRLSLKEVLAMAKNEGVLIA